MADRYDELTGEDLENAFREAHGPTDGGSNQDGTLSADEKREYLRNRERLTGSALEQDIDKDDPYDDDNPHGLSDDERAQAQAQSYPAPMAADLRRAHAENDREAIAAITADINNYREARFAQTRRG